MLFRSAAGGDLPNAIVIDNFQATGEHYSNGVLTLTDASGAMLSITVTNPGANFEADLNYTIDRRLERVASELGLDHSNRGRRCDHRARHKHGSLHRLDRAW